MNYKISLFFMSLAMIVGYAQGMDNKKRKAKEFKLESPPRKKVRNEKTEKEKASIRRILFQEDMPSEQSTEEEKEKSINDLQAMFEEYSFTETEEQNKQFEDAEEAYSTESLLYNNLVRRALQLDTYSLEEKKAHARDLCAFIKAHQRYQAYLGALAISLRRAIINQFREKQYIPNPHAPVGGMGSTMIKLVPDRLPTKN